MRIESWNPPTGEDEPMHVHPRQESRAEVLPGTLRFVVDGQVREVGPGESLTIPPGVPHMFGNHSGEEAHSIAEFRPALRIVEFFEYLFALGARGQLDEHGMPNLLELAVSAPAFADEIRVTTPPWPVQRAVFAILAPIARRRGLTGPRLRCRRSASVRWRVCGHASRRNSRDSSATQLPLDDGSLDGAITVNTLCFVSDLDCAFKEVSRVLRKSGRLVIGIGDPDAMSRPAFAARGFRLRSVDEIGAALTRAGLTIVDHRRDDSSRNPSHVLLAQPR